MKAALRDGERIGLDEAELQAFKAYRFRKLSDQRAVRYMFS